MKFIIVFLFLILNSFPVFADGNRLYKDCTSVEKFEAGSLNHSDGLLALSAGTCLGMMESATRLNLIYQARLGENALFCLPESGLQNGQTVKIVMKYLKEHPEELHLTNIFLIVKALRESFPCD